MDNSTKTKPHALHTHENNTFLQLLTFMVTCFGFCMIPILLYFYLEVLAVADQTVFSTVTAGTSGRVSEIPQAKNQPPLQRFPDEIPWRTFPFMWVGACAIVSFVPVSFGFCGQQFCQNLGGKRCTSVSIVVGNKLRECIFTCLTLLHNLLISTQSIFFRDSGLFISLLCTCCFLYVHSSIWRYLST